MLTIKEVQHIAKLARLELTKKEEEKLVDELSSILGYVDKLQEVNTDGVEITSQVTGLINSVRKDVVEETSSEKVKDILTNAPEKEENLFKVKNVF
ncbi:Asp-tRNA(Asn)/Glu-tRNA(Gln) amidotransferase subunit GatC [Candidatus Falkowbacteria bacterium]|jgi:aspartyl-tRNA(Asn)/glutamyl-tRNA(Gln) amidotransferase subunit C|nr:Asp-tRNA(Asn)/Glu-tRNA(Gln) amidotransferase subunit GatC [Candidatus Falkowbacteria bacterium]MBT4433505.1 Asp-tRNA(Asn)/Glu-tRNA(Gln) amidotransferase subunit GatC [Candidatus Falkowbacteria bacterium]